MRMVVIMDPVSTVIADEDTTFALMREAERRGHRVDHCLLPDVELHDGQVSATVRRATSTPSRDRPLTLAAPERVALSEVDAVLIRKDPPFDVPYLWLTVLLDDLVGKTHVVNDPTGVRAANEKLYACRFSTWMPKTLVTRDKGRIRDFLAQLKRDGAEGGGAGVLKPIDGHGGAGIFRIAIDDGNFNAIVEAVTQNGSRVAMLQEFLPRVAEGDKRILLLAGDPLGAILRVPQGGDHRSNIHVGGRVVAADLTKEERALCEALKPQLLKDGLYFVGIDVIGEKLTEVNVTSPTGIQQMSRLSGTSCEARVLDWLETKVAASP